MPVFAFLQGRAVVFVGHPASGGWLFLWRAVVGGPVREISRKKFRPRLAGKISKKNFFAEPCGKKSAAKLFLPELLGVQ
jgi:hypothetical protein